MTGVEPIVLVDTCGEDESYCEDRGHVEAIITEEEARRVIAEYCQDAETGEMGAMPVEPARRVWLRVEGNGESWVPCEPSDDGAVEFFEFDVTTAERPSPTTNGGEDGG